MPLRENFLIFTSILVYSECNFNMTLSTICIILKRQSESDMHSFAGLHPRYNMVINIFYYWIM